MTTIADVELARAEFEHHLAQGARRFDLRGAEIAGIRLNDPKMFRGAIISHGQAATFLRELDLIVI